ncbi:exocyst subunit [Saccharomycopsis crataegensis]|uniref:Exocyst complex component EXO84 n=1 Tax=Saccharomycopsis crataegensis TaxID=43959 RepID=A0AAV5QVY1_9ASCO|nr:exocyst subunit [Saccharomycopsis crataegensis]
MSAGNASLRKSRAPVGDWRKFNGKGPANPYANLEAPGQNNNNLGIPKIPSHDKQKIKRRLSMKVEGAITPDFAGMPSLPSSAMAMIAEHGDGEASMASGSNIDLSGNHGDSAQKYETRTGQPKGRNKAGSFSAPLADPDFDAHRFVITKLQQAKAADVDSFTTRLITLEEKIDEDIKNNVNKSYEKILIVSNDLNSTDSELKTLKSTINTLQEITLQMKETAESRLQTASNEKNASRNDLSSLAVPAGPGQRGGGRRDRSSIMILEKRWVDELNNLFKHVEGAQKFLTANPSRHVLAESGRWFELNAATWKPLHSCHLFVLNDHVMIATSKTRRNNQGQARSKLVAEQCWQIREVKMIEIPEVKSQNKSDSHSTLNFKYHGSSYIYQTNRKDQYIKIVSAFKKAQSQLRDITEQESQKQRRLRDSISILSASEKSGKRDSGLLQALSARMHTRTLNIDNSAIMRNLRDIDDMIDEIDINIAHHKFGEAVELVKLCDDNIVQRKKEIKIADSSDSSEEAMILLDVLKMKLDQRKSQLETALVFEINDELNSTEDVSEFIFFLRTLDMTSVAKENLLLARSQLILKLVEEVDFEGDLPDYITQVSIIRFQIIKATTVLFKEAFPEPEYSSDIVKWCTEEVKKQADLLKKQLFDVKYGSPIHKTCIDITKKQVADLRLSGLDVDFLLDSVYSEY